MMIMASLKGLKGKSKPYDPRYNPSGKPIHTKKTGGVDGYFKKFLKAGGGNNAFNSRKK